MTEERKSKLLTAIERAGYIKVDALASMLFASASTIRRNLTELETMGLVKRNHGGVEITSKSTVIPVKHRFKNNHTEKSVIAEQAAEYLCDNSIIFVDASSTCLHLLPFLLNHKNLTVFTNGLELASLLAENGFPVYTVGGKVISRSLALVGDYALHIVQSINFDALFFSGGGFQDGVITDYSIEEAYLRQILLKQAKSKYFLCDGSKFGKTFPYIICKENEVTKIITER